MTLVPGAQYQVHGVMSRPSLLFFGTNNRSLWNEPLTLPVVDPAIGGGRAGGDGHRHRRA